MRDSDPICRLLRQFGHDVGVRAEGQAGTPCCYWRVAAVCRGREDGRHVTDAATIQRRARSALLDLSVGQITVRPTARCLQYIHRLGYDQISERKLLLAVEKGGGTFESTNALTRAWPLTQLGSCAARHPRWHCAGPPPLGWNRPGKGSPGSAPAPPATPRPGRAATQSATAAPAIPCQTGRPCTPGSSTAEQSLADPLICCRSSIEVPSVRFDGRAFGAWHAASAAAGVCGPGAG